MILSVCNSKGGSFKSNCVLNLAISLSKYNPVIIDTDSQQSITYLNNIREQSTTPFELLTISSDKELEKIINKSTKENLYIIDTGGFDSSLTRISVITADVLVSPTSSNVVDLLGLNRFEKVLKELSAIKKEIIKTNVFINNINPQVTRFDEVKEFINASEHFNLLNSIIRTRADFPNSANKGLAVKEYNPVGKASLEFQALSKEIMKLIDTAKV